MTIVKNVRIEGGDQVIKELKQRGMDVRGGLETILRAGGEVIRREAAANADGDIATNMTKETVSKNGPRIAVAVGPSADEWYASFVEFGTRAHPIRPKSAKALKFEGRYAAHVNHPGTRKKPFLRPALDEHEPEARDAIGREAAKVARL